MQARGHEIGETPFESYEEMIACYCEALMSLNQSLPQVFIGWSMGGYLAHDVACCLADQGHSVAGIVILDSVNYGSLPHDVERPAIPENFEEFVREVIEIFLSESAAQNLNGASESGKLQLIREAAAAAGNLAADILKEDPNRVERFMRVFHQNTEILAGRSATGVYGGPALVIRAADTARIVEDPALGWVASCGSVNSIDLPYDHQYLLADDASLRVIEAVTCWLEELSRNAS